MARYKDIGPWLVQLLLLTAFTNITTPQTQATDSLPTLRAASISLDIDRRLKWREEKAAGPRCFKIEALEAGFWWIELRSSRPATTPSLIVLSAENATAPRMLERLDGMLIEIHQAGEHIVCLTSAAPLGNVEIGSTFLKGGDPLEIELDPNPLATECDGFFKGGDPLEIELDPNP